MQSQNPHVLTWAIATIQVAAIVFFSSTALATIIPVTGQITNDTTWTAGDTVLVSAYMTVAADAELTIDPGAVVIYDGMDIAGRPVVAYSPCATAPFTISGAVTGVLEPTDPPDIPQAFHLSQNYPNPFNAGTTISYTLDQPGDVAFEIFNILGQRVWNDYIGQQPAGRHTIHWNGRDSRGQAVPSGIYFYRLSLGEQTQTKKMVLLR